MDIRKNFQTVESDLAPQITTVLAHQKLLPTEGTYSAKVEICLPRDSKGKIRKARRSASAENWDPQKYVLLISFEKSFAVAKPPSRLVVNLPDPGIDREQQQGDHDAARLVQVLDEVERKTTLSFIALKKFRDGYLANATGWNSERCDETLRESIQTGVVRTRKIPNPPSPFPTTAIELSRQHPLVQRILGPSAESRLRFDPVRIAGAALSETVLKERR
ncbi:MAG: hypothetical protein HY235_29545 [Acidobacteria bacterium]|nr:hypothetical protein [Acidobacteriota bacterium]